MSKRNGANLLPKLRLSIVAAFATIFLALALSPWSTAFAAGPPVATVTCGETQPGTDGFSVEVDFNELVMGSDEDLDDALEISVRSDVFAWWLSARSYGPHGGFDSVGVSSNFHWMDSNGDITGQVTDEELDVTFRMNAGAVVDFSGESNTASNTLHVSVNRTVSVGDASTTEGADGTVDFEVTLGSRNDCETVTVDWSTADDTATAGEDYTADSGTLTFGPGEMTKTVSIAVLDDSESEGEESFTLELSNASRATIADAEATGTIADNEVQAQVSSDTEAPTVTVTSNATGPVTGEFDVTVTFSEPVTGFAMSELAVTNGSAARMLSNGDGTVHTVTIRPDPGVNGNLDPQLHTHAVIANIRHPDLHQFV